MEAVSAEAIFVYKLLGQILEPRLKGLVSSEVNFISLIIKLFFYFIAIMPNVSFK